MNLSNSELDQLFESVRNEKPVASYKETERAFVAATIASAGGVLATKGLLKLFTFKQWIMMISVLSAATVGTLLVTMSASPVSTNDNKAVVMPDVPAKEIKLDETKDEPAKETTLQKLEKLQSITAKLEESRTATFVQTRKIVTQYGKPPVTVRAYLKDDGSYHFEYVITSETTAEDLKKLQEEAKEAGFQLKYEPTFADNKLQKLSLHIVQEKENGQQQDIRISEINLEEDSEYKVAWNVDNEGNATTIACGESFKSEEMEKLLSELQMAELTAEMERLQLDLAGEMTQLQEELQKELADLRESELFEIERLEQGLLRAEELLSDPDFVQSLAEAHEELDDDVLEEIREGLEEAREGVEEAREAMEEEHEHMRRECKKARSECEKCGANCRKGSKAIRTELVKDGLIDEDETKVKMKGGKGKLKVNGKDIPRDLRKKYKGLVAEYFNIDTDNKGLQWEWEHTADNH